MKIAYNKKYEKSTKIKLQIRSEYSGMVYCLGSAFEDSSVFERGNGFCQ